MNKMQNQKIARLTDTMLDGVKTNNEIRNAYLLNQQINQLLSYACYFQILKVLLIMTVIKSVTLALAYTN